MKSLRILHVNTHDHGGGAAQLAYDLLGGCLAAGHQAWMAVREKARTSPYVYTIRNDPHRHPWARLCDQCLRPLAGNRLARAIGRPLSSARVMLGHEDFDFPGSRHLLEDAPERPDLVHLHNLHGSYFDLRVLPTLSGSIPTFVTLHDAWMTSGHCSHSFTCERWRSGCGHCPALGTYPAIARDATAYNWRRKRSIFERSRLHVAVPCRWMMEKVQASILAPAVASARIIPHGIDLSVFKAGDKASARKMLGLPADATILLFASKGIRTNVAKDYDTLRGALEILGRRIRSSPLLFLAIGETGAMETVGCAELRFIPHVADRGQMAQYYQAGDVYVHAARAEQWGLSITEAMACGLPVVASCVGGIPDQVDHGRNGFLVTPGDIEAMAEQAAILIDDIHLRARMGHQAEDRARQEFGLERMVGNYLSWYANILTNSKHALPNT